LLTSQIGVGETTASGELVATAPVAPLIGETNFKITLTGVTPGTQTFLIWDTSQTTTVLPNNLELALSPAFQMFAMGTANDY
jgi:hypothetical protein